MLRYVQNQQATIDNLLANDRTFTGKVVFSKVPTMDITAGVPLSIAGDQTIDPATWGEIDPATFPKILNVNTQYFTNLVSNVTSGESLISEITSVALNTLKQKLGLSEDWTVI